MPAPGVTEKPPVGTGRPSQKSMTKAERRELQEKQRAAKAALSLQQPNQPKSGQGKQQKEAQQSTPTPSTPSQAKTKTTNAPRRKSVSEAVALRQQGAGSSQSAGAGGGGGGGDEGAGKPVSHGLRIFAHFGQPKPVGHTVKGDIHPAIIRLGLLFLDFKICGANARCIATLTAFKTVIQDYTTPPHNTLSRHLMTHLSPQITHLVSTRPMSVTMGNAIRELKLEISKIDIDMVEQDAKDHLCTTIDNYIRDRILIADEVIQDLAGRKIKDGDVILTYARSSVVEKVLLQAQEEKKKFSVIVVDSKPLLEGKKLLESLTSGPNPIPCTYALLPALPALLPEASIVLLGAHSVFSTGAVYSRAGTAMVAMMAKAKGVPVLVCCETYKFSESVLLDGFSKNELVPSAVAQRTLTGPAVKPVTDLETLNPLYDLTPATYITAVVTEVGLIPPNSLSSIPLALGKAAL